MDLTRLAVDAGQFINRAIQYTGESIGQADKTELDPGLERLLARADATKTCTDKIISQTEALLQPNPGARLEDRLYERLEWNVPPRPRALELLGDEMTQAGLEIGSNTPYGNVLLRCGETQKQHSETERQFVQSTKIHFLTPLRSFTEGEYRAIQEERRMLLNKRLDLDVAKTRLRKAHEAEQEDRNLNANTRNEDYVAHVSYMFSFLRVKWLKIWAQQISQAEMEVRICQNLFDRQSEITRRAVEAIDNTHTNHMRSLTDFVEAQACYFDQCNQHAQELQKQLASIPAVLCSNNWQSDISNQPSTSNHAINEPKGLNPVNPLPELVHQLPDFDQDSWTINPPPGSGRTLTQPQDMINNNNNNNSDSSENRCISATDQTFPNVCRSNSDNRTTDLLSVSNRTFSTAMATNGTTAECPDSSQTQISSPVNAAVSGSNTANAVSSETMATDAAADEPQTTSETANEQTAINEENALQSTSAREDVV